MSNCPQCGAPNDDASAFCGSCGAALTAGAAPGQPTAAPATGRGIWVIVLVVAVLGLCLLGLVAAGMLGTMGRTTGPASKAGTSTAEATGTPAATSTPPATAAPAPAPPAAPQPAPGLPVTQESGESYCYVEDVKSEDGKDYVIVDYVQLGTDPHESEDYDVFNTNPKLRTFEITPSSWLGAYWMAADIYGEHVMEEWNGEMGEQHGGGYEITVNDMKSMVRRDKINDYSYWFIIVNDGRVKSLVNTYQD